MGADIRKAAASDAIEDTLNYKAVAKRVIAFVEESQFQLVETLAERVAELVLREFQIPWLRLRLNKAGAVRGARDVGVIIERGRMS
jgi:dihydroneopterin aldolase